MIIFLHIPKTAGTTLSRIIERQYSPEAIFKTEPTRHWESVDEFAKLSNDQKKMFKIIMGHMYFGLHEYLPERSIYLTMMRDPIDRIISYYYYVLRYPDSYLYPAVTSQQMDLKEFARSGLSRELDNFQTRLLAGEEKVGLRQCSHSSLERAKENMNNHFGIIGISEMFDESLLLMKKAFGWNSTYYVKSNVTKNRPSKKEIPRETLDVIEENNSLDVELYKYIRGKFEDLLDQEGSIFEGELKEFRAANLIYGYYHRVLHRISRSFPIKLSKKLMKTEE
jgi:hypothetical protein